MCSVHVLPSGGNINQLFASHLNIRVFNNDKGDNCSQPIYHHYLSCYTFWVKLILMSVCGIIIDYTPYRVLSSYISLVHMCLPQNEVTVNCWPLHVTNTDSIPIFTTLYHDKNTSDDSMNNSNNSIYLYSAISPEIKFCSEALITTVACL